MSVRSALPRPGSGTPRDVLARVGRWMLWLSIVVVLLHGVAGILTAQRQTPNARVAAPVASWPDDAARAFAAEFVAAYLRLDPAEGVQAPRSALAGFAAPELVDRLMPQFDVDADADVARQPVLSVNPAGAARLGDGRALITVAARTGGERPRGVRLTVPVARDARGGLVVYDLPSLAAAPARANVGPQDGSPILGDERAAIADVLTRYLRAYVSGDRAGLAYLVPAGTPVAATAGGFELLDLGPLTTTGATTGPIRVVLVTVHVRDRVSGASYALRYRVRLVRRDRWYVAAINDARKG